MRDAALMALGALWMIGFYVFWVWTVDQLEKLKKRETIDV